MCFRIQQGLWGGKTLAKADLEYSMEFRVQQINGTSYPRHYHPDEEGAPASSLNIAEVATRCG
jgi:hypothetical protein